MQGNAHNEGKPIVAETFTKTFKNKIYKCMTSLLKTVYIDKLDDIINEYNSTYHTATEINPNGVKSTQFFSKGTKFLWAQPQKRLKN